MIDITIKTLDSRNHSFSVGDELTVKQLKEHIAEPVNVPAESQRLIYCGRVLLDDKKLSEYDVHGKVIHLVQRAPPGSSGSGGNSSGNEGQSTRSTSNPSRRPWRSIINPGRVDGGGNAMYLGAMAFPADLIDAQVFDIGITMPQPRHGLSQSRLSVARTMLRRARYTLQNLENPTHQESPGELNSNIRVEESMRNIITAAAEAAAAAAVAAVSASASSFSADVSGTSTQASSGGADGASGIDQVVPHEEVISSTDQESQATDQSANAEENASSQQSSQGSGNGALRPRYPRTSYLAELIVQVREVNRRLQPFFDQYYELMRDDPTLENPADAQRLFTQVSEMMHFMAHAYHALSDIMCDFSQPPPRLLRCRPVLIQHSAVLQTGIPIQAQFSVGTSPSGRGGEQSQSSENQEGGRRSDPVSLSSSSSVASASSASSNFNQITSQGQGVSVDEEATPPSSPPLSTPLLPQPRQMPQGINLGGGNFEFYMDVGPSSITIDSVEATVVTSAGTSTTEPSGVSAGGNFPWGSPPTPEFIQNLMQALASQILIPAGPPGTTGGANSSSGGTGGTTPSVTTESNTGPQVAQGATATNSQARVTTATHPTTATQTRSTSRPQVHFTPGIQVREHNLFSTGMGGQTFFDPFLPCNSHHIRGSRRRSSGAANGTEPTPSESQDQPAAQSSSTQSSSGSSNESPPRPPPNTETVINLLSNVFGSSSQMPRQSSQQAQPSVIRILPRDVTILLQGPQIQGLANVSSFATVAELLQGLPDHSYTEGQSLFMDLFMTLARNLRVSEVLNMGSSTSNLLVSLRPVLSQFVRQRLLEGRNPTSEVMSETVDRINEELRPFMESIQVPMRDDIDLIATINQLNHRTFPLLISDVLEGDNVNYSRSIPNICNNYARKIVLILLHCAQNGQQSLEPIFTAIARRMIIGVPSAFQNWSVSHIVNQLRTLAHDPTFENIQQYLVYRAPQGGTMPEAASATSTSEQEPEVLVDDSEPMDLVPDTDLPPINIIEADSLPDVIIGAEPWHNGLPPEWVPIITRDRERQRRQAVQGPLSEAYLSGMPSKRRKVVNSTKPHGPIARVISESMATALGAAGVTSVDGVAETAGNDSSLRAAFREQVRTTVEATVRSHPDYKPEKYPNTAKFFESK